MADIVNIGPVASNSTADQLGESAYLILKSDILTCALAPGTAVTEAQLANRMGFGKAPVRNALTRLCHEGLMRAEPRKGYRVTTITLSDIQDTFQLRLLLEPEAARLSAGRLTDDQIETLWNASQGAYEPSDDVSRTAFLRSNRVFHMTIAEASGNARLAQSISQLLDETERILHLGLGVKSRGERFQDEHKTLISALIANQPEKAAELVREQINGGLEMVVEGVLNSSLIGN